MFIVPLYCVNRPHWCLVAALQTMLMQLVGVAAGVEVSLVRSLSR
jgi:hypothetical protein